MWLFSRGEHVAKLANVEGEIREFVRQQNDFHADGQPPANNVTSLLQGAAGAPGAPEQEIDNLIAELQAMRERLQSEGSRVQQRVVDYATMSQSAMQSVKAISESLQNTSALLRRSNEAASL